MLILIIRKCWISHPLIDWTSNQSTYSVHTCITELWLRGSTTVLFAHAPKRSRETTLYHWSHWCTWHWAFFTTPHIIRDIINHEELRHHSDKKRHFGFIVGNINFFNYILLFYLSCAFILKCVKWIFFFFFLLLSFLFLAPFCQIVKMLTQEEYCPVTVTMTETDVHTFCCHLTVKSPL